MDDVEARLDRLERYVKDDAERWHAAHERIGSISHMLFIGILCAGDSDPKIVQAFILGLSASLKLMRETNEHGARIGEIRQMLEAVEKVSSPTQ